MRHPVTPFKPQAASRAAADPPAVLLDKAGRRLAAARELVESLWVAEIDRPDDAERFPLRFRLAALCASIRNAEATAAAIRETYAEAARRPHPRRKPR
jgi:hypothetical protein